jgi:hypothetical protein
MEYKLTIEEFQYKESIYEMDLDLDIEFYHQEAILNREPDHCQEELTQCDINNINPQRVQVYNEDLNEMIDICGVSDDFIKSVEDYIYETKMDEIVEYATYRG